MPNVLDKQKNRKLFTGVLVYAIGDFGTKILSFLIVPLYTYYISTSEMGIYDLLISTISLLAPIITLQISDAAYRWLIQEETPNMEYARGALQVVIINCILVSMIVLGINYFVTIQYYVYFVLILWCSQLFTTLQKIVRGIKNQRLFTEASIFYTAIYLVMNVMQICILHEGITSLFTSSIIAYCSAIWYMGLREPRLQIKICKRIDVVKIKEMVRFSVPLIPNQLNWWIINSADRYIVSFFLGVSSNGILSIVHKFPTMLQLLLGLFNTAWQDLSVADAEEDDGIYYTNVFRKFYKVSFTFLWIVVPFTKVFIDIVMSETYRVSANYVPFYYLGAIFQGFSSFYGVGYLKSKNTKSAFSTSIYGAIVNALVNILLIRFVGLYAASFSTFVGFLIMWIVREIQNRNVLHIHIRKLEFIILMCCSIGVCMLSILLNVKQNIVMFILGVGGFGIINSKDILTILNVVIKKIKIN